MPAGDGAILQGVLNHTMINGDEAKNIFVWRLDKVSLGDYTDTEVGTIVTDAIELIFAELLSIIKATVTYDTVDIYKRDGTVWDYLTTTVPSITPTGAYEVVPPGVAMLMTAYTDLNKVFGRKFIYGATESEVLNGVLNSTGLTALANAADEYISSYNGAGMGALDYLVPGVWSTKIAGFEPFNGIAVVKNTLSYQRRRKTGVGV